MRLDAGGLCRRAVIAVMFIASAIGRPSAQSPAAFPPSDLLSDLAARVVAAVAPLLRVSVEAGADPALDAAMTEQLLARGVQMASRAEDVPSVRVQCLNNLRERVCSAEIAHPTVNSSGSKDPPLRSPGGTAGASGDSPRAADGIAAVARSGGPSGPRSVILVTRAHEAAAPQLDVRLVLQLRPVISHEGPILDIARTPDDLLVLTPTGIVRYENRQERWQQIGTRAITAARPWPRDIRGRLHITGTTLEAFLPGRMCTGSVDALVVNCVDSTASWPLDIDGGRLAETRNYFATPEGLTFFGIARLGADAGASWLAATLDHQLAFVGAARRFEPTREAASDVAAIHVPCASTSHVVASTADPADERLVVLRVVRRQLLAAADSLALPGRLTALWPTAAGERATVVTRDRDARRYVAHELAVSCAP